MAASKDYYVLPGQYHCPGECPRHYCLMMDGVVPMCELSGPLLTLSQLCSALHPLSLQCLLASYWASPMGSQLKVLKRAE